MDLVDLIRRTIPAAPWADGAKIPWHEPGFSERMLAEHLTQEHDLASRRAETIDRHVAWIHETLLRSRPSRILDLGCGPGLYTSRLAARGHACTGMDISPASITHAEASSDGCRYVLGDVRIADLGEGHDLVMFLFGEINVFPPEDALTVLRRAHDALAPGGSLLLEPHAREVVESAGRAGARFSTHEHGLFGREPYLLLEESFWVEEAETATTRWWVVDAHTNEVQLHAQTVQAYDDDAYRHLLSDAGFENIRFYPSLTGDQVTGADGLFAVTAGRAAASGRTRSR